MYLKSLYINNFKNFKERDFTFSDRVNCIFGPNGVGKTNLLDSIYYLSFCKSCFNNIDISNIHFDEQLFSLQAQYLNTDKNEYETIFCALSRDKKKLFKRNDKQYEKLADHIGFIPLIMITPNDILLINGGGDERRKFIDAFISQFDNEYLNAAIYYNKLLSDRNKILKSENNDLDTDLMEVLNARLVHFGMLIYRKRKEIIEQILPIFQKYYTQISHNETVSIIYESQLHKHDFASLLQSHFERDKILGYTSAGTHRDDFTFLMNEIPVKNFGSQGQKKSFLLALKFTQQEYTSSKKGIKPILLLDDLFDKLDKSRVENIISIVSSDLFGQIFISDTDKSHLKMMFPNQDVSIIELTSNPQ